MSDLAPPTLNETAMQESKNPELPVQQHNGQHYFSMKLIEGDTQGSLSDEVKSDHRKVVELVSKVADAVHQAHHPVQQELQALSVALYKLPGLVEATHFEHHLAKSKILASSVRC